MSKAIKCDRCGTCFGVSDTETSWIKFMNPCVMSKDIPMITFRRENLFTDMGTDEYVDLCPVCSVDFQNFMARKNDTGLNEKDGV